MAKVCARCQAEPAPGAERYCKHCRKLLLQELHEAGYLTQRPGRSYRSPEKQEVVRDTKFGPDR